MFSSVRPAYRCLTIGSLGGRAKITSEVCLPHTTHEAQHTSGKKIYRAKHVLSSKVEGTPSTQSKTFTYFSEPWRLCVFARVTGVSDGIVPNWLINFQYV